VRVELFAEAVPMTGVYRRLRRRVARSLSKLREIRDAQRRVLGDTQFIILTEGNTKYIVA